jgi:hypothetical protein
MSSQSSVTPPNVSSQSSTNWLRIWFTALAHPSISTYENIADHPQASAKLGYLWVVITEIISALISSFLVGTQQEILISLVCGIPLFVFGGLLALVIIAGSAHWIARLLGGAGNYPKTVYVLSAFSAPITILSCVLYFLPFGKWLIVLLSVYWIILTILAIKALYKLSWGKSALSSVVLIVTTIIALITMILLPSLASAS